MPCDPDFLMNINMFEQLNEDDRQALAKVVDELDVPAGRTLFQKGSIEEFKLQLVLPPRKGNRVTSERFRVQASACLTSAKNNLKVGL